MAGVRLEGVSKVFGNTTAVAKTDLEIKDGEFLVLVGPSGCGKSTTLRMIAGLETPTEGDIYIGERKVTHLEPKDRDIAMVFQNYALYPHMKVFDNMAFGLRLRKVLKQEIEARVKEAAEILGIAHLLDRYPKQLSGGQRQRVALGRAIVRNPQVFLMDEPLSNLDAKLRVQMRAELIKLHQRLATTVIYVTHDQVEAMTMGARIVVMKDGVIQQVGTPMDIYYHPKNIFVAGFVGSPPMNFFKGNLEVGNEQIYFKTNGQVVKLPQISQDVLKYKNVDLILGIRPEDVKINEDGNNDLTCTMEIVEHIGSEAILHARLNGGDEMIIKCATNTSLPKVGQKVNLTIDPKRVHLFEAASGNSILSQ
ncbi:Oligosaccharides import ATP-binding protein MsmX [Moorella humiferrea]|uniref:ABC transporter ATP-binding protein n=1 Tax=Neomoorella humiferrea TaxID=676965 RepID=UPI0030D4582B